MNIMDLIYAIAFIATIIIPSVPLAIFTAERGMDIITAMVYVAYISLKISLILKLPQYFSAFFIDFVLSLLFIGVIGPTILSS